MVITSQLYISYFNHSNKITFTVITSLLWFEYTVPALPKGLDLETRLENVTVIIYITGLQAQFTCGCESACDKHGTSDKEQIS
jgi:hypothetical protein